MLDGQADGMAIPQGEGQLQLIRRLVHQQILDAGLLLGGQFALFAMATPTNPRLAGVEAAPLVFLTQKGDNPKR